MLFVAVIFIVMFITHLSDSSLHKGGGITEFRRHIITSKALIFNKLVRATEDFLPLLDMFNARKKLPFLLSLTFFSLTEVLCSMSTQHEYKIEMPAKFERKELRRLKSLPHRRSEQHIPQIIFPNSQLS